jgi:8-oxo-dGTP diphosphatase
MTSCPDSILTYDRPSFAAEPTDCGLPTLESDRVLQSRHRLSGRHDAGTALRCRRRRLGPDAWRSPPSGRRDDTCESRTLLRVLHDASDSSAISLGVAAIIFDGQGRVLLIKKNYGKRRYGLPGGRIEAGETPRDAVLREVQEETGMRVHVRQIVGVYYLTYADGRPPLISIACRCEIESGEPTVPASGEIGEVGWFHPDDLPAPLTNLAPHAIADAARGAVGVIGDAIHIP